MIFNQTEKQEKEYLQQVITTIHDTIKTPPVLPSKSI